MLKLLLKDYRKITYFFSKTFSEFFIRGRSTNPVAFEMKLFATIVYSCEIWIWMLHVAVFVNRPLLIWLQYFILYSCLSQVNLVVISRFTVLGPSVIKGNNNFEILLIKTFSLKQKSNQILPASTEKIKFCLVKKTASCSFRL